MVLVLVRILGTRWQAHLGGHGWRHLHHLERRCLRLAVRHTHHQPAAGCGPRYVGVLMRAHPVSHARTGMHSIRDRPVVVNGQIVIRPIMIVALTYDHRLLDGREATTFLGTRTLPAQSHCISDVRRSQGPRLHPGPREDAPGIEPRAWTLQQAADGRRLLITTLNMPGSVRAPVAMLSRLSTIHHLPRPRSRARVSRDQSLPCALLRQLLSLCISSRIDGRR